MKFLKLLLIGGFICTIFAEVFILLREERVPLLQRAHFYTKDDITIESINHQKRNVSGEKPFTKYEGDAFGLAQHNDFSVLEFLESASRGRGIASGDFNNDGWQDILLATSTGVLLYKNLGRTFALQNINLSSIQNLGLGVHVVAFVDIDNNGWQDIYLTTYGGKNYFLLNDRMGFKNPKVLEVPNTGAVVTLAVSFGDLDKDGDLDFVNGNWTPTSRVSKSGAESNKFIRNNSSEFIEEDLQEFRGKTLSVLLADFTNDNNLDLITGDEFERPDNFYRGEGREGLVQIKNSDGMIPVSPLFNMSIDVADFNNDLYMDVYMSGVGSNEIFRENPCLDIQNEEERQECKKNFEIIAIVRKNNNMESCTALVASSDRNECLAISVLRLALLSDDKSLCVQIPEKYTLQRFACLKNLSIIPTFLRTKQDTEAILQIPWQNVLLQGNEDGVFKEVSKELKVANAFNSWNAKFADLDNDEWQDIYIVTGEFIDWGSVFQPNIFFHNSKGNYFEQKQAEFGLEDIGITSSYLYVDIDNDGDLDIISAPMNEPLKVYVNNETKNNSITFQFQDIKGNHFGIGNKIYITYGENSERHQIRQIKSGGGYASFDPFVVHFGLGKYDRVNKIEIVWSTGEKTTIDKEFLANKSYVISRSK